MEVPERKQPIVAVAFLEPPQKKRGRKPKPKDPNAHKIKIISGEFSRFYIYNFIECFETNLKRKIAR